MLCQMGKRKVWCLGEGHDAEQRLLVQQNLQGRDLHRDLLLRVVVRSRKIRALFVRLKYMVSDGQKKETKPVVTKMGFPFLSGQTTTLLLQQWKEANPYLQVLHFEQFVVSAICGSVHQIDKRTTHSC